jgi:hypothetical protein
MVAQGVFRAILLTQQAFAAIGIRSPHSIVVETPALYFIAK